MWNYQKQTIVKCFILVIVMVMIVETIKQYKKNVGRNFTDVFDWKPFRDSSAWRCNQRVSTCEFDPVICVCQYGNHATQNVSPKET